jgi:6-phosphofructokinase 1
LGNDIVDLGDVPQAAWESIRGTPGAALGSSRTKLITGNEPIILNVLKTYGIGFVFLIGGNDSAETARHIGQMCKDGGLDISVLLIPKTIDNDLPITDHSPGYGSAGRFLALATMGAGQDALAMGPSAPLSVIEVMGRDTGWLAYASALGKRSDADPPHVICIPEEPVSETTFLHLMQTAYSNFGYAIAVVAENCKGENGALGSSQTPWLIDGFGHEYYESPAKYLSSFLATHLSVRVRHEHPGVIQRSFQAGLSTTDRNEASLVATAASDMAKEGASDGMVTLIRESNEPYSCRAGFVEIERIANQVKQLPPEFINSGRMLPTSEFMSYAQPLIGDPLPVYLRI